MGHAENFISCVEELAEAATFDLMVKTNRSHLIKAFELSVQTGCDYLRSALSIGDPNPRAVIDKAAAAGYPIDRELWRMMVGERNKTVHVYSKSLADQKVEFIPAEFLPELEAFSEWVSKR